MPTSRRTPSSPLEATEQLRSRFLDGISQLTVANWLVIARRYRALEAKLQAQRRQAAGLNSACAKLLLEAPPALRERAVAFSRREDAVFKSVIAALPERVADGAERLPLREWALAAGRTALSFLRFADDSVRAKDKAELMALGLEAFKGLAPLPPLPNLPVHADSAARAAGAAKVSVALDPAEVRALHLLFPPEYLEGSDGSAGPGRRKHHVTWKLPAAKSQSIPFGGLHPGRCAVCGGRLHRLIQLPERPLPTVTAQGVSVVSCLSCLGWSLPHLFFKHGIGEIPTPVGYTGPRVKPKFVSRGLREGTVRLAPTPLRWRRQPWAGADDQNLNRIGGSPSWIEGAEQLKCPECGRRLRFLLQLDSGLPGADGEPWLWGSGGILYVLWCATCRIDGQFWQCT